MSEKLQKILYVEDDEDIAEIAKMTMEEFGDFQVHHCLSGIEALEKFPTYNPQLILMDVMMPQMDGLETFRRLKKLPLGGRVPVVFMTAKAQTHEQEQYINMGALGVIIKPFDTFTLCDQLERLWEVHHDNASR